MVSAAVAGDDLQSVAGSAADALARPVAIALPALGAPVVCPPQAAAADTLRALVEHAATLARGEESVIPAGVSESVPIRIGPDVVGVVAALGTGDLAVEQRTWLEAAATAAAVASLMREAQEGDLHISRRALLQALATGALNDAETLLAQARRLGYDFSSGALALCASYDGRSAVTLPAHPSALLSDVGGGRVLGLVPLSPAAATETGMLTEQLRMDGLHVATSAPRRDPAALHEALREAELLVELGTTPDALLAGQEETYRLLIGVLLRDADELAQLRERTIAPLSTYDAEHDTDLLATLQAFLAHHGSTTETAEAMSLHRHTVGYRLSRVHEVSGLSPYESDGRERLSLGLKADQIIAADRRRAERE